MTRYIGNRHLELVWWIFILITFLDKRTWIRCGTSLIPLAQMALLSPVSMDTSGVPTSLMANLQISLSAWGTPWNSLHGCACECRWCIPGHSLIDGRMALLLAILLWESHYVGLKLERCHTHFISLSQATSSLPLFVWTWQKMDSKNKK